MIPVLRSIDSLLNRFDELSQRHAYFVSNFERNFTDTANPLRDVSRDEDEQRKTTERLLNTSRETDDRMGSIGTLDEFNRHVVKSRSRNRPPSYSSNDTTSYCNHVPSRSSFATIDSTPILNSSSLITKQVIMKPKTAPAAINSSSERLNPSKTRTAAKNKSKILPYNDLPRTDPYGRNIITTFTVETVNRLSMPKAYHGSPVPKPSPKRVHRRPKVQHTIKRESSVVSIPSISLSSTIESPRIKRTNAKVMQTSPKRIKTDKKVAMNNSKKIPTSNYPRPTVVLAPPPRISLTFPMQPELQSSRVVTVPKSTATKEKTIHIFSKKGSTVPSKRLLNLMSSSDLFS